MSRYEKIISYVFFTTIIVSPFLVLNGINNPYEFPKFIFIVLVSQLLAITFLFYKTEIKFDLITKIVFLFIGVLFLANLNGLDFRTSLLGNPWRHQGLLLYLSCLILFLSAKNIYDKKYIELSIQISGILLGLITILEFISINNGINFPTYNGRVVATMGNPNFLGGYLALALIFILFQEFKNKYLKPTWIFIISISIFITQSKSALIALVIALISYSIFKLKIKNYLKFIISFLIIGLFIAFLNQSNLFQRESVWDTRTLIWEKGIDKISINPILGVGQDNFELVFPKELNFTVDNAHNIFLETIISSGFIGLILFLSILIVGFKNKEFKYKLFLITFLTISFFNPLFISGIVIFWIILGFSNNSSSNQE